MSLGHSVNPPILPNCYWRKNSDHESIRLGRHTSDLATVRGRSTLRYLENLDIESQDFLTKKFYILLWKFRVFKDYGRQVVENLLNTIHL